ncbi:SIS domain-containing protein, partial [Patescibacteria group bacterium]
GQYVLLSGLRDLANIDITTEVDYASEFRYRNEPLKKGTAILAISQSGETADTLAAIRKAKKHGLLTLGIINVVGSSIAREVDAGVFTRSGPEIAVASTKVYTSQLIVLALMALHLAQIRGKTVKKNRKLIQELSQLPKLVKDTLKTEPQIKRIARKYYRYENFAFMGRKYNCPTAYEGAIKLKEISYIHAEGFPSGEMKHGPISMIDRQFPSVFITPQDSVYEKNLSNMEEIKARHGRILAVATKGDRKVKSIVNDVVYMPRIEEMLSPVLAIIPLQIFAYYIAVFNKRDVDKPRNLAKSVTVE